MSRKDTPSPAQRECTPPIAQPEVGGQSPITPTRKRRRDSADSTVEGRAVTPTPETNSTEKQTGTEENDGQVASDTGSVESSPMKKLRLESEGDGKPGQAKDSKAESKANMSTVAQGGKSESTAASEETKPTQAEESISSKGGQPEPTPTSSADATGDMKQPAAFGTAFTGNTATTFGSKFAGPTFASFTSLSGANQGGSIFATGSATWARKDTPVKLSDEEEDEQASDSGQSETNGKTTPVDTAPSDKEPKLKPVDSVTGEEDEITLHQVKCKLFEMDKSLDWCERGVGTLKVNQRINNPDDTRLVMRTDVTFRVILNAKLFPKMHCQLAQERFVRIGVVGPNGTPVNYALKVRDKFLARELHEAIESAIPSESKADD
ncbi:hypothetical protein IWQ62_003180 [Dispira parvispora]|uniref:RanBD1 domain-containing protein n=1 Tax=Dispira parvispora TaxID=1520584 RepID=A0A9W8AVB2_9FUNG|nr:hypothetical protein IWQ62_003180 [Dispira parvispora]